jgi:predicted RNase H-like nuclease (RuvC/YqgF family)
VTQISHCLRSRFAVSGAQLVISRLRTQLPQFFTDFDDINDIASALAYVDRGALAIYTRLKEQDAKISELNSVVANLTNQVQDLTVKLDAAQIKIQIQDNTIQSLNTELEKLKAAYSTLSSLSKSIQDDLEKELDNARKEIKKLVEIRDLLKENLELAKKRLEESERLIEEWRKAAISAQGALQAVGVLAYATTGFLIGGPVGAAAGAFFGEDIITAVSQGKAAVKNGLNSAAKKIKSWF